MGAVAHTTQTGVSAYEGSVPQTSGLLGVIERIASNPDFDVEKMSALLKMRADEEERLRRIDREDREDAARREWLAAFSSVQSEIGPIFRTNDNKHTKSKYADLADIERIVTPILTRNGFSTTSAPIPCDVPGHIRMRLTIGHFGGHEKVYEDDFPLDAAGSGGTVNKTAIQAKGSTQTYARRYLKASALDLAFMDDRDGNKQKPVPIETITDDQVIFLRELIEAVGANEKRFLAHAGLERLEDIGANKYDDAVKLLKSKERNNG